MGTCLALLCQNRGQGCAICAGKKGLDVVGAWENGLTVSDDGAPAGSSHAPLRRAEKRPFRR
jgi:hypothetical protein